LAWVKVHAQGEPSEPGHPQARNGNARRVSVPFLKDVVSLDEGLAVHRALERGGPTTGALHSQFQYALDLKGGLGGFEAERAAGPTRVCFQVAVRVNGIQVAQWIDVGNSIKDRVQDPVGLDSELFDTLFRVCCILLCADLPLRFGELVAAIVIRVAVRALVSVRTISA
jgi:hypothetical protein